MPQLFNESQRERFSKCNLELLCSYTYPYANFHEFRTCCDYMSMVFIIDELIDEQDASTAQQTAELIRCALMGEINDGPGIIQMFIE